MATHQSCYIKHITVNYFIQLIVYLYSSYVIEYDKYRYLVKCIRDYLPK